ncbi:MAG: histidine triad nucleotide-binding protein [Aquificaceae bacterium]
MQECIFCKIARKEIPSRGVYEDDLVYAFHDINPIAPTHILIIPKRHIVGIQSLDPKEKELVGHMFYVARLLGEDLGYAPDERLNKGYRLVFNVGRDAGQSVFHLHLHFIAGRSMEWPPG